MKKKIMFITALIILIIIIIITYIIFNKGIVKKIDYLSGNVINIDYINSKENTGGVITSYSQYKEITSNYNIKNSEEISQETFNKRDYVYYVILAPEEDNKDFKMSVNSIKIEDNKIKIIFNKGEIGVEVSCAYELTETIYLIPIEKGKANNINNFEISYNKYKIRSC